MPYSYPTVIHLLHSISFIYINISFDCNKAQTNSNFILLVIKQIFQIFFSPEEIVKGNTL